MSSYARTASGRYLGSLYSDEETDREQRASVPVVLDDSNVHAIIDDVESRPHTAESAPAITSKPSTIADKSSVNPPRNIDTGDLTPLRSQPIPSHDDPAPSLQRGAAKTPPRRAQSLSATSHTASHRQETSLNTTIPSVSIVSSTPVTPTAPTSFSRVQEDRMPPTGRSTPVNDRDHRQSRRRSVMDNPRISGFLNNFLHIHREREHQSVSPSPQSPAYSYGHPSSPQNTKSSTDVAPPTQLLAAPAVSRPPTPPPPSLPPPTLNELGMALNQLSEPLPPPFPSSGVFLAPNCILLCNQHGLDVMPLPLPGQQVQVPTKPYALIRRVSFKSCVVMEERGVLVAIAGRRDGVRVYALEEVRRAVEWRIDVEVRKEMDRLRREEMKRLAALPPINVTLQAKAEAAPKSAPPAGAPAETRRHTRKSNLTKSPSMDSIPVVVGTPGAAISNPVPSPTSGSRRSSLKKRSPKLHKEPRRRDSVFSSSRPSHPSAPAIPPSLFAPHTSPALRLVPRTSIANLNIHRHATRRAMSAREAMAAPVPQPGADMLAIDVNEGGIPIPTASERMPLRREPTKGEWMDGGDHSDEEILVAAGPSGSAALDERTSAAARASVSRANLGLTSEAGGINNVDVPIVSSSGSGSTGGVVRQRRPSNLDLSPVAVPPEEGEGDDDDMPSPAPTLLTLRQAIQATAGRASAEDTPNANTLASDHDEPNAPTGEVISFAEWLLESRLPDAPPLGIGSGRSVRRRGASVGSAAGAPVIPAIDNTVLGAALVTRYPLSHGYDLYGTRGNGGAGTEPGTESTERRASDRAEGHDVSDAENGGIGRRGRPNNATQGTRPASRGGSTRTAEKRKSRRWSVLDGILHPGSELSTNATSPVVSTQQPPASSNHSISTRQGIGLSASQPQISQPGTRPPFRRHRSTQSQGALSTDGRPPASQSAGNVASDSEAGFGELSIADSPSGTQGVSSSGPPLSSRSHRSRLSRFFHLKTSKTRNRPGFIHEGGLLHALDSSLGGTGALTQEYERRSARAMSTMPPAAPAPKLEYIKLPGTKGAIMVKAVETARKSFLAILCGEAGEKVELFAGTYRTALGLSRTFILPDSPKTLELQLQGDDLVEVFLVFPQNVFGLEPATVRVREVRIGRAERRAARRRAARSAAANPVPEDLGDVNVNVVVGTGAPVSSSALESRDDFFDDVGVGSSRPLEPSNNLDNVPTTSTMTSTGPSDDLLPLGPPTTPHPDEVAAAQLAAMWPYTTFQQLSFAPLFPLGALAEECMIPPTYKSLLEYKAVYEPESMPPSNEDTDEGQLLAPPVTLLVDVLWFYCDPKGVVQGPWKASLMQSWFKDGFLPPDLPVRRETQTEYILLRDLRRQSIDPNSPFRPPPPGLRLPDHVRQHSKPDIVRPDGVNPLLEPISLLAQPKHFGPPALFFSSRGGHSTSIVDARGRSVLKGRFNWTLDDEASQNQNTVPMRLGDVKHLEAFEVDRTARAVVVAFRQGGIEAVDIADAIMTPGDGCRTVYPYFNPPPNTINRRKTFVWRVGDEVEGGGGDLCRETDGSRNGCAVDPPSDTIAVSVLGGHHHFARKAAMTRGVGGDILDDDREPGAEGLLVIGRDKDKVYFCDRRAGTFRLMCLTTMAAEQ